MEESKKYGYARVSSTGQNLSAQINQLKEAKCTTIYQEKVSGRKTSNRDQFNKLLDILCDGDTIVVTKLDRFARSTKDALQTIEMLDSKGISLVVLNMGGDRVDTSTAIGKLMITVLSGIAEFEADMIRERQIEGIAEAKARGVYKGRPHTYTEKHSGLKLALELYDNRDNKPYTMKEIAEAVDISKATIYRAIRERKARNNQ